MAERDPRVDPKRGDVLIRLADCKELELHPLKSCIWIYPVLGGCGTKQRWATFLKWAATATVIRRAEDGTGRKDAE